MTRKRRRIADLESRLADRERAAHNLLESLECTDAHLRALDDRLTALEGQGFDDRVRWHREFSIGDDDGGRVLWYEGEEPITPREGEVVECRWVSDWETLDDVKGDDLRTRLVHAAVESLVEGDPVLVIGVGENELKIGWEPQ